MKVEELAEKPRRTRPRYPNIDLTSDRRVVPYDRISDRLRETWEPNQSREFRFRPDTDPEIVAARGKRL